MKSPSLLCNTLAALLAVALATPLAAQQQAAKHHNYKVLDVGTLAARPADSTSTAESSIEKVRPRRSRYRSL